MLLFVSEDHIVHIYESIAKVSEIDADNHVLLRTIKDTISSLFRRRFFSTYYDHTVVVSTFVTSNETYMIVTEVSR